jgi:hypothetical protein
MVWRPVILVDIQGCDRKSCFQSALARHRMEVRLPFSVLALDRKPARGSAWLEKVLKPGLQLFHSYAQVRYSFGGRHAALKPVQDASGA